MGKPERLVADVGLRIAEARHARGLTQEQLATKLGVTTRYVAHLEAGANITIVTLALVASALGIEPKALLDAPSSRERRRPGRPTSHAGAIAEPRPNPSPRRTRSR